MLTGIGERGTHVGAWVPQTKRATRRKGRWRQMSWKQESTPDPIPSIKSTRCAACISRISRFWWFLGSSWVQRGREVNSIQETALTQLGHGRSGPDPQIDVLFLWCEENLRNVLWHKSSSLGAHLSASKGKTKLSAFYRLQNCQSFTSSHPQSHYSRYIKTIKIFHHFTNKFTTHVICVCKQPSRVHTNVLKTTFHGHIRNNKDECIPKMRLK